MKTRLAGVHCGLELEHHPITPEKAIPHDLLIIPNLKLKMATPAKTHLLRKNTPAATMCFSSA
jgi:hypothetical protein